MTGGPLTQAPLWQESFAVQRLPSSQAAPFATLLHVVLLTPGWQLWQGFVGFGAPAATHAPPIKHPVVDAECVHAPADHVSFVHARPSSAHAAPSAADVHAVVLCEGAQT